MEILDVHSPSTLEAIFLYLSACLMLGGFIRCLSRVFVTQEFKCSYLMLLIFLGMIFSGISLAWHDIQPVILFVLQLEPQSLVAVLVPSFIFKTAYQMDFYIFQKSLGQILLISTVGFGFNFLIVGVAMALTYGNSWPITICILFGIIVTLTDSQETSKFLGQFKNLGVLQTGEEMITLAAGLFVYDVMIHFDSSSAGSSTVPLLLYQVAVPAVFGFTVAKIFICLLNSYNFDFCTNICLSFFITYTLIYGIGFLGASGLVAFTVFGIIICCHKKHITADAANSLVQFWELIYVFSNFILFITAGALFVFESYSHAVAGDIVWISLTYLLCVVIRSSMVMILYPLLCRIGYGLNWRSAAVAIWGALKGTSTLLLAVSVYIDSTIDHKISNKVCVCSIGIVLLHFIINGMSLNKIIGLTGFTTLSALKLSSMDNIVLHVMSSRDRAINVLKLNRLFADAAWDTVRIATNLTHPYKYIYKKEENINEATGRNKSASICPDCKKEVVTELTDRELQEIKNEAYMRILKAKKVSYWRQCEWGLLTREANRTLVAAVEDALEKNSNFIDIEVLKTNWKPGGCLMYMRNTLVKIIPQEYPKSKLRASLKSWQIGIYRVVTDIWWDYGIFLLVILHAISIALDFAYRPKMLENTEIALISFSSSIYALLIIVTSFAILGVGGYNFMRSIWYLLDVVTIVISFFYTFYVVKYYFVKTDESLNTVVLTLSVFRAVFLIRLFRIFTVFRATIPKIVQHLDKKIDIQLAHGFDVGKGFVTAETEILKLLPRIVTDRTVMAEIKLKMEADRREVTKCIGNLQRDRPTIAMTVKTKEAAFVLLHVMKQSAKDLKDSGLMDDHEYNLIREAIEDRRKFIGKRCKSVSPPPPDTLFRQVVWLIDDEEAANFLMSHSLMVNLNYEEILIKTDEIPQGIYIIVSGLVKMVYTPDINKIANLLKYGALPNVDYPVSANFRESQEDYIGSGTVIGEIGVLTGRTHDTKITCESSVQAYFITTEVMNYAINFRKSNITGLEQRIWKAVAVRLASIILPSVPIYQSWNQEKIFIFLERAFVPKLSNKNEFVINQVMDAVFLIEGQAYDLANSDLYIAPTYIPRTVRKLTFVGKEDGENYVEPILLIVPSDEIDEEELMAHIESVLDLKATTSMTFIFGTHLRFESFKKFRESGQSIGGAIGQSDVAEYSGGIRSVKQEGEGASESEMQNLEMHKSLEEDGDGRRETSLLEMEYGDQIGRKEDSDENSVISLESTKSSEDTFTLSYFNYKPLYGTEVDEMLNISDYSSEQSLPILDSIKRQNEKMGTLRKRSRKRSSKKSKDSKSHDADEDPGEEPNPKPGPSHSPD